MHSVGQRIKAAREAKALSQTKVAEFLGVTRGAVSQWENDASAPSNRHLGQLAALTGASADWLLSGVNKDVLREAYERGFEEGQKKRSDLGERIENLSDESRRLITQLVETLEQKP